MKVIATLALLLSASLVFGQNFIDTHFDQYGDLDKTTVVHVAAKSFELASFVLPVNDEDTAELKEFIGSVNSLDLIAVPQLANARAEYDRGKGLLQNKFEELVNVKDKSSRFSLFIDEENDIVYELVGIGTDKEELFVVSITGEMDLSTIGLIIDEINSKDFKSLKNFKKYNASEFRVYPNPVKGTSALTINIPEGMIGGNGTVYDLKGASIDQFNLTNSEQSIQTKKYTPGTYVISLEKDGVSVKKQVVIIK